MPTAKMDAMPVAADHLVGLDDEQREAIAGVKADLQRLLDERTGY